MDTDLKSDHIGSLNRMSQLWREKTNYIVISHTQIENDESHFTRILHKYISSKALVNLIHRMLNVACEISLLFYSTMTFFAAALAASSFHL